MATTKSTEVQQTAISRLYEQVTLNILSLESTLNVPGQLLQGKRNSIIIDGKAHKDIDWSATLNAKGYSAKKFMSTLLDVKDGSQDNLKALVLGTILEQMAREVSKRAFYSMCAFENATGITEFVKSTKMSFPDGTDSTPYWTGLFSAVNEIAKRLGYSNVRDIFEKSKTTKHGDIGDFADLLA